MASLMRQWSENFSNSTLTSLTSSSTLEDESETISHLISLRYLTISAFAVHHCAHVIFLRAQLASSRDPIGILLLAAKSKRVGAVAESVLKILSKVPSLYIADSENIPKNLHRLVIDNIYEELLSMIGTPFELMKAFNAGSKKVEQAFAFAFQKTLEDEDLESCLFDQPDTTSPCEESTGDRRNAESFQNSTSMSMLLLLKLLANGPPYSIPIEVPPQELMNTVLTLWTEALDGGKKGQFEKLYKRIFIDLCGRLNIEQLFHMRLAEEDGGFHDDDIPKTLEISNGSDRSFTCVTPLSSVSDFLVSKHRKKKSWLSCFSILRFISKQKLKKGNNTASDVKDQDHTVIPDASKGPSLRCKSPLSRSRQTYIVQKCTSAR
ncbi:uncharacterized protein LOC125145212 isoform X3 [Tachysurus fulvidraco]|uniref:uncharacterized protein LOC125145212 isoform X3 n=1 Tax=Tachysurus fulvidraco TaxID=1234273 RepID=UPI001FEE1B03|nr:uncharacterized protein LOC125145212 isoform X3 [Tachysurus fulvidraco]